VASFESSQAKAISGDPIAMTDVGWLVHKGRAPILDSSSAPGTYQDADIPRAIEAYKKAAELRYSPASSLLADLYFYGKEVPPDLGLARRHLEEVLDTTLHDEPADAYVRGKALRQLGIADRLSGDVASSKERLSSSVELVSKHLNGNWAFILPHDPPGLWELLSREQGILEDSPLLARNLSGFAAAPGRGEGDSLRTAAALRSYTNALRAVEAHDKAWAVALWEESLERFPEDYERGSWGVTYLESLMRVYGHPILQKALREAVQGGRRPAVSVLGSALGNTAVWPSLAFGFSARGYEALGCCVDKAKELVEGLKGEAGDEARSRVEFFKADVFGPNVDLTGSDVVWSNDFQWGEEAQSEVEKMAFDAMDAGGCLVLYRRPREEGLAWNEIGVAKAGVSWDPELPVFILRK